MLTKFRLEGLKETEMSEGKGVDGRTVLRWILRK
jgi:hypothetical protein